MEPFVKNVLKKMHKMYIQTHNKHDSLGIK